MIWRALRHGDIVTCLNVKPTRMGAELVGHDRAAGAWRDLIHSSSFQSAVVEAEPPIAGHRIVSFGASVFVSRDFADDEISNPRPGLNARIISSVVSDHPVVLSEAQLRSANTKGGLDLVILYGSWRKGIPGAAVSEAQTLLTSSFLQLHQGFRLNRLIVESVDELEIKYTESASVWRTISDFREFHAEHADTPWNKDRSLAIVTVENAFHVPGQVTAILFQYREPVLGFRKADQELLSAALTGLTDEDLACSLNLGLPAVKKRWRSLFERASTRTDLFPNLGNGLEEPGRGRQKRQFILTYVREHPEELRPFGH